MLNINILICSKAKIKYPCSKVINSPSLNHLSLPILKHFVHRWQMNATAEFLLPSMIPS